MRRHNDYILDKLNMKRCFRPFYILLLVTVIVTGTSVCAQNDSLVIKKIEKILKDSRPLLGVDQKKVFDNAQLAIKLAKDNRLRKEEWESLKMLGYYYLYESDYDKAIALFERCLIICESLKDTSGIIDQHFMIGQGWYFKSMYGKAMKYYQKGLAMARQQNDSLHMANLLYEIGWTHYSQGNLKLSLTAFLDALRIQEKLPDDENSMNSLYNAIGNIYFEFSDFSKAMDYYQKSLDINKKLKNNLSEAHTINNIANVFLKQQKYREALEKYGEARLIFQKAGNQQGVSITLNNIGMVYDEMGEPLKAIRNYEESIRIKKEIQDLAGMSRTMGIVADLLIREGEYRHAIEKLKQSLQIAENIHLTSQIKDNYKSLSEAYKKLGDMTSALDYHEKFFVLHDSIYSEETQTMFAEMQTRFETEQKEKEIQVLNTEKALQETKIEKQNTELRQQQTIIFSVIGGFLIVLFFSFLTYRQYRQKKRANEVLKQQKEEIESQRDRLSDLNEELLQKNEEIVAQRDQITEQRNEIFSINRDIMASIRYALRLQQALLPQEKVLKEAVSDYFIIYLPKDIVSGDFYWMKKQRGSDGSESVFVACADCTGHGVPGAFMSIVSMNLMEKAFFENKESSPADILNYVTNGIYDLLRHSDQNSELKDGMDVALCKINRSRNTVEFAGARNSLVHISGNHLTEYKGDKHFIGDSLKKGSFDTYTGKQFAVTPGDTLYMYSDGFPDQFSEKDGKKYYSARFRKKLTGIAHLPMNKQKDILLQELSEWKGALPQVDDILVMGVRV
jgi:tetratricopeptide (TPR) repeat protein